MNKKHIFDIEKSELIEWLKSKNQPKFRADQIYSLAVLGYEFSQMQTLPQALRKELSEDFIAQGAHLHSFYKSNIDDTNKLLFELSDGNIIEGVLMNYDNSWSLCISTQVGCRMSCSFCASTLNGLARNLTPSEMLAEIIVANNYLNGEKVSRIVLMGSGEALDNYDNTIKFLKLAHYEKLLGIGYRHFTISTCGLVPQIYRLMDENLPITLAISLHAWDQNTRETLMPVAKKYHIDELIKAAKTYVEKTGRRVTFEYAVMEGVNSSVSDAKELAKLLRCINCHVNVIPLNSVKERDLQAPSSAQTDNFVATLNSLGINTTKRRSMGSDIGGACGQLRNKIIGMEGKS